MLLGHTIHEQLAAGITPTLIQDYEIILEMGKNVGTSKKSMELPGSLSRW